MMKKIIALGSIILIVIMLGVVFNKKEIYIENESKLSKKIKVLKNDEIINLKDITKFEWDEVYFFQPYIPKEDIYKIIGYKWDNIYESTDESMNQIVF